MLAGRRGISLRGFALAAVVLMLAEPQEVVGVSFQMSFSAVLALIVGYAALRPWLSGLRGDGYFSGGRLTEAERATHLELMRETARAAGRDPAALEYTRWGAIDMTADDVAAHAASGTTRLVAGPASTDLSEQKDQISAFAARLALG